MQFWATLGSAGRKAPPLEQGIFLDWIYPFHATLSNFGFGWQKSPPPIFLLFCERSDSSHTCGIPMVPIGQIHTQISPIWISSIGYQLCQLFKLLTYRKYRTQYHGTSGRPIGSLTTIHNNIPPIPITLVDMALWNVIRLLYVYAYISWSAYMAKLLVIHFGTSEVHIILIYGQK